MGPSTTSSTSVAAFLATLPHHASFEAHRLMELLLEQRFLFNFLQAEWTVHTSNGTPQGGSHSAGLFARRLDHKISKVTRGWESLQATHLCFHQFGCCSFLSMIFYSPSKLGVGLHASCLRSRKLSLRLACTSIMTSCAVASPETINKFPSSTCLALLLTSSGQHTPNTFANP